MSDGVVTVANGDVVISIELTFSLNKNYYKVLKNWKLFLFLLRWCDDGAASTYLRNSLIV